MSKLIPWQRPAPLRSRALSPAWRFGFDPDMDRMLSAFFNDFGGTAGNVAPEVATRLDVSETDDEFVVRAEVPGVEPDDLDISVLGDVLTLSGEKRQEETREEEGARYTERSYGSFRRELSLSSPVDVDKVTAEHKNGVVSIRLPKAESTKPKRIEVKG